MLAKLLSLLAAALASTFALLSRIMPPAPREAGWSAPAALTACAGAGAAQAVFPSDSPRQATGPGAVVFGAGSACRQDASVLLATIGADDAPGAPAPARTANGKPLALREPLSATGGPRGQIVIAGSSTAAGSPGALSGGRAAGPLSAPEATGGPSQPVALATAYLGDVAAASPHLAAGGRVGIEVRAERHYEAAFAPPLSVPAAGPGPVRALRLALDFRADAIAVWWQAGAVYARDLPASGHVRTTQRLASAAPDASISALLSDDNRSIVAWSEDRGGVTSVYLDVSAPGVTFGAPVLLERFRDPLGGAPADDSPLLVRLSSESVLLAWTGAGHGRWAVRAAAVGETGVHAISTISTPASDALLDALAAGPDDEAIALWSEPLRARDGQIERVRTALYAARGIDAYGVSAVFGPAQLVAPPGPNGDATLALDPDSDRALCVWHAGSELEYAIRSAGSR